MILVKPKFWDKKIGILALLLFPLSLILIFFIFLRKKLLQKKKFDTSIICIGNIYLGGTGKTPTSILLANEITRLGKKVTLLRKFYECHRDEHELIKNNFKNFKLNNNRIEALKDLDKSECDVVILDDGLQDYKIHKNLNIVCFNQNQLIGNGLVLPAGPLRERLTVLKDIEIVIINGKKNEDFEKKILKINKNLNIFYSHYIPININRFRNKKLFALAGIGNPENFFQLIEENHLKIEKKFIYPDHYKFSRNEILNILREAENKKAELIMTEKDYYKFKDFNLKDLNFLKVSLEIKEKNKLLKIIEKIL